MLNKINAQGAKYRILYSSHVPVATLKKSMAEASNSLPPAKRPKRQCHYNDSWSKQYKGIGKSRPVARGGSGGSIEPPISGSVYCAVQSVHSMPHGFGRRQSSRIHNIEQCSAARLAAPRLHKRARRSERADVYNNNN